MANPQVVLTNTEGASLGDEGGSYCVLGPWNDVDVAASQAALAITLANDAVLTEIVMPRAGSIVGIACFSNAARTAGDATFDATINGTVTGLTAVLDATNTTTHTRQQAAGLDRFTAGQRIGVKLTTPAGWTPITADAIATVLVIFD